MSITAYMGLPGSGKSYQVVSYVILRALRQGRRVVTNISGLKDEAIYEYLTKQENYSDDDIGEIVHVSDDDISAANFYYSEDNPRGSIVQPGDLLIIDEAWQWFEDGTKLDKVVMNFFRYHRHYVDENNVSCDVALVTQDVMDIGRKIRRVIETTVVMHKLKELGSDTKFRIEVYSKTNIRLKPINTGFGYYKKKYYDLYESYAFKDKDNTHGIEQKVEARNSIFSSGFFKYVFMPAILFIPIFIWLVLDFVSTFGMTEEEIQQQTKVEELKQLKRDPSLDFGSGLPPEIESDVKLTNPEFFSPPASPPTPPAARSKSELQQPQEPQEPPPPKESTKHKIVGHFNTENGLFVMIQQGNNRRIIKGEGFKINELGYLEGIFNNEIINKYTGGGGLTLGPAVADVPEAVTSRVLPSSN